MDLFEEEMGPLIKRQSNGELNVLMSPKDITQVAIPTDYKLITKVDGLDTAKNSMCEVSEGCFSSRSHGFETLRNILLHPVRHDCLAEVNKEQSLHLMNFSWFIPSFPSTVLRVYQRSTQLKKSKIARRIISTEAESRPISTLNLNGYSLPKFTEKHDACNTPDTILNKQRLLNESFHTFVAESQSNRGHLKDMCDSSAGDNFNFGRDPALSDTQIKLSSAIHVHKESVNIHLEETFCEKPRFNRDKFSFECLDTECFNKTEVPPHEPITNKFASSKAVKHKSYSIMEDLKTIDFENLQRKVTLEMNTDPLLAKTCSQQISKMAIPAHLSNHAKLSSQGHLAIRTKRSLLQCQDKAIADEAVKYLNSLKSKSWVEGFYRKNKQSNGRQAKDLELDLHNRSELPDRSRANNEWGINLASKSSSKSQSRAGHLVIQSRQSSPRRKTTNLVVSNLQRKFAYTFEHSPRVNRPICYTSKLQNSSASLASGMKTPNKSNSRSNSKVTINNISRLIESIGLN